MAPRQLETSRVEAHAARAVDERAGHGLDDVVAVPNADFTVEDDDDAGRPPAVNVIRSGRRRDLDGIDTTLTPGDVVTILPAVSGG